MVTSKQEILLDKARKAVRRYADGIKSPNDRNRQMAYEDALVNWVLGQVSEAEKRVAEVVESAQVVMEVHAPFYLSEDADWYALSRALDAYRKTQKESFTKGPGSPGYPLPCPQCGAEWPGKNGDCSDCEKDLLGL